MALDRLTPRQREIVTLIASGVPVKQIGDRLAPPVTEYAVRRHIEAIARRLPGEGAPLIRIVRAVIPHITSSSAA